MIKGASSKNQHREADMTVVEQDDKDIKRLVVENFSKILESSSGQLTKEQKLAFGKTLALNLITFASIGLVIGFLVSLIF
jgi:F0F1-type ATP synthase assembly protein I